MCTLDNFLASVDWGEVAVRLTAFALSRLDRLDMANPEDAQDLAQEAIQRVFDPKYRNWSPSAPSLKELMKHLGSKVNGIVANRQRSRDRRGVVAPLDAPNIASSTTTDGRQDLDDLVYVLLDRLDGDDDACTVLDLFLKDVDKAAEQANTLQWPTSKVYEARRRIRAAARRDPR